MALLIQSGRVIDPAQGVDAVQDVLIEGGRIRAVGAGLSAPGATVLKAAGRIVAPGFIDLHAHLREPGFEHKETIATGTRAAARGGFTTVACMSNTRPVIDSGAALEDLRQRIRRDAVVNVLPQASLTRGHGQEELSDFEELGEAIALTDDAFPIQSAALMRSALHRAAELGKLVTVHCEDQSLTRDGVMHEGEVSRRLQVAGMPACAEEIMVARNILLARDVGARLHLLHVSTAGSVALLHWARAQGLAVTGEACPHHFALTDEVVVAKGAQAKVNPPLRTATDVAAIREGLRDGTIEAIATDHAPHAAEEKARGLLEAPGGILGLETALSVVGMELVEPGLLSWPQAITLMAWNPARILGIERGTLAPGAIADVVIFDPAVEYLLDPDQLASKSRNTPWAGRWLRGRVAATVVEGNIVYRADV